MTSESPTSLTSEVMTPETISGGHVTAVDPVSEYTVLMVQGIVSCGVISVLAAFGFVANIFNVLVFLMQGLGDSVNVSLFALTLADLVYVTLTLIRNGFCVLEAIGDTVQAENWRNMFIPQGIMLQFLMARVSSALTALIALERCVCVLLPLHTRHLVTRRCTAIAVVCIYVVVTATFVPVLMMYKVIWVPRPNDTLSDAIMYPTDFYLSDAEFLSNFSDTINSILYPVSCLTIVAVCTLLTTLRLKLSSKWRRAATATSYTTPSTASYAAHDTSAALVREPSVNVSTISVQFSSATRLSPLLERADAGQPLGGFSAGVDQPVNGFPVDLEQPLEGFSGDVDQPVNSFPVDVGQPLGRFSVVVDQPLDGFPVDLEQPLGGFSVVVDQPIGGFPVDLEQPLGGFSDDVMQPFDEFPADVGQPLTVFPADAGQPHGNSSSVAATAAAAAAAAGKGGNKRKEEIETGRRGRQASKSIVMDTITGPEVCEASAQEETTAGLGEESPKLNDSRVELNGGNEMISRGQGGERREEGTGGGGRGRGTTAERRLFTIGNKVGKTARVTAKEGYLAPVTRTTNKEAATIKLTRLLVTIATIHIVCLLPSVVATTIRLFVPEFSLHKVYHNSFYVVYISQFALDTINASVNFIVYMTMSSRFLRSFRKLMTCLSRVPSRANESGVTKNTSMTSN